MTSLKIFGPAQMLLNVIFLMTIFAFISKIGQVLISNFGFLNIMALQDLYLQRQGQDLE